MVIRFCRAIQYLTGHPMALVGAIVFQILWMIVGSLTHLDPFPFVFMLTISNVIQLILIFVIGVAQNDHSETHAQRHDETHAKLDQLLQGQQKNES